MSELEYTVARLIGVDLTHLVLQVLGTTVMAPCCNEGLALRAVSMLGKRVRVDWDDDVKTVRAISECE